MLKNKIGKSRDAAPWRPRFRTSDRCRLNPSGRPTASLIPFTRIFRENPAGNGVLIRICPDMLAPRSFQAGFPHQFGRKQLRWALEIRWCREARSTRAGQAERWIEMANCKRQKGKVTGGCQWPCLRVLRCDRGGVYSGSLLLNPTRPSNPEPRSQTAPGMGTADCSM